MNTKTRGSKRPSDPDVKCIRRATRGAFHPKIKSASSFWACAEMTVLLSFAACFHLKHHSVQFGRPALARSGGELTMSQQKWLDVLGS